MSSKYDYVKIKVVLHEENYFILSRFLLTKMLLFCQVPPNVAVRVSLDVKKHFVDEGQLQISERELKEELFRMLEAHGCGSPYTTLYNRLSEFQTARVPLVVFIAGTGCCGKSSIAQMLCSKLSNFHLINTDLVLDTLSAIDVDRQASHRSHRHLWVQNRCHDDGDLIERWNAACHEMSASIRGEIHKALREGKAVIVEGTHINLSQFSSYLIPAALDQTVAHVVSSRDAVRSAKGKKAGGRPILVSCLMTLPSQLPPIVLDERVREQERAARADDLEDCHFSSIPSMDCLEMDPPSPPKASAGYLWDSLHRVQAAHEASIASCVSGEGERLEDYVLREVFDVQRTAEVVARLHSLLLRRICDELDRQQMERGQSV